ncbi:MAG: hypothetical protein AAF125_28275, partial [Chloroflexota bacterium]
SLNGSPIWPRGRMSAANQFEMTGNNRQDFIPLFQQFYPQYDTLVGNNVGFGPTGPFTSISVEPRVINGQESAINMRTFVVIYREDLNPNEPHTQ